MRIMAKNNSFDIPYEDAILTNKTVQHYLRDDTGKMSTLVVSAYRITAIINRVDIPLVECPTQEDADKIMKQIKEAYISGQTYIEINTDYKEPFLILYKENLKKQIEKENSLQFR